MNCAECEILLHALIDGELDAGHARDVEAHVASCPACAEKLRRFRAMRAAMAAGETRGGRPGRVCAPHRSGIAVAIGTIIAPRQLVLLPLFRLVTAKLLRRFWRRRSAVGALAASLMLTVFRTDPSK